MWYRYTCLSVLLAVNWDVLRLHQKTPEIHILLVVGETIIGLCSLNSDVDAWEESISLLTHNIESVSIYMYNYYNIFNITYKHVILQNIPVFIFRPTNSYMRIQHSHCDIIIDYQLYTRLSIMNYLLIYLFKEAFLKVHK